MDKGVLSTTKQNVFEAVTAHISAAIEEGVGRCAMPWQGASVPVAMPRNAHTDKPYQGINVVVLWAQGAVNLYPSGYWASYKQWQQLGAQVRKGERGSVIVFYKKLDACKEPEDSGEEAEAPRAVLRHSYVFNAGQVEGWDVPMPPARSEIETNEQIAAFVAATKADVRHGGYEAYYSRKGDYIAMPQPESFRGTSTRSPTEAYYAVLLHELTHWTGATHRLDRTSGKRFGDRDYAFEELVAELGAAFLCSAFRLVNAPRPDHAAYIARWLEILGRDNRAIFSAASLAQKAVEYLRTLATDDLN